MAVAFVGGATSASSSSAGTTKTISYSPTAGNTLLVFGAGVGVAISKVSDNIDTTGATYSKVAGPSTNTVEGEIWSSGVGGVQAGVTTITVTFASSTRNAVGCGEYSGVHAFGNVNNSATGSSASPGASVTTQDANNFVVCGMSREGTSTWSTRSGAGTLRKSLAGAGSTTPGIGISDNTSASPGSVTAGATISSSGAWCACAIELRGPSTYAVSLSLAGAANATDSTAMTMPMSSSAAGAAAASASPNNLMLISMSLGGSAALADSPSNSIPTSGTLASAATLADSPAWIFTGASSLAGAADAEPSDLMTISTGAPIAGTADVEDSPSTSIPVSIAPAGSASAVAQANLSFSSSLSIGGTADADASEALSMLVSSALTGSADLEGSPSNAINVSAALPAAAAFSSSPQLTAAAAASISAAAVSNSSGVTAMDVSFSADGTADLEASDVAVILVSLGLAGASDMSDDAPAPGGGLWSESISIGGAAAASASATLTISELESLQGSALISLSVHDPGPRTALAAQSPVGPYPWLPVPAGALDLIWLSADSDNGNEFSLTGREVLFMWNPDASAHRVTLTSAQDERQRFADLVYELAPGAFSAFSFRYGSIGWKQSDGNAYISADDAAVQLAVVQIKRQMRG